MSANLRSGESGDGYLRLAFIEAADELGRLFEGKTGALPKLWRPSAEDIRFGEVWKHLYLCIIDERGGEEVVRMLALRDAEISRLEAEVSQLRKWLHDGVKPVRQLEVRT